MPPTRNNEFALFIDESGSPKPNTKDPAPYFALGGVLVRRNEEELIRNSIINFKKRWDIKLQVPLHGNEICAKKRRFAWLGKLSAGEQEKFMLDLSSTITSLPITVHACVVSRQGYLNRYIEKYGDDTWEMMKSSFSILVERVVKHTSQQNESIMIYYEKAGKKEDKLIESYFEEIRTKGHPFNQQNASKYSPLSSSSISKYLRGIEGDSKSNEILQVADLCLYPVSRAKEGRANKAYEALKINKILIDCQLKPEEISSLGIKYYCFDKAL